MARGAIVKQSITETILKTFPGSFLYNGGKEIRIPMSENGDLVQVKVSLTAAKVNVEPEGEETIPAATVATAADVMPAPQTKADLEPSAEEKKNVETLLKQLGMI